MLYQPDRAEIARYTARVNHGLATITSGATNAVQAPILGAARVADTCLGNANSSYACGRAVAPAAVALGAAIITDGVARGVTATGAGADAAAAANLIDGPNIVRIDPATAGRGTPGFDLLNNPPPNTRIVLTNGNVYVTNSAGIVDEVTFQPRLVTGTRDARQTAVGRQGLDTDVGGHIQACSLGGTCDRVNLFPQDRTFNNSEYRAFENEIRRALERGDNVGPVTVRFVRPDPANPRPSGVNVTYTIGGRTRTIPFENQARGGP